MYSLSYFFYRSLKDSIKISRLLSLEETVKLRRVKLVDYKLYYGILFQPLSSHRVKLSPDLCSMFRTLRPQPITSL